MEDYILSLNLLDNRLNKLVHIHNDLHNEADQTLDEKEVKSRLLCKCYTMFYHFYLSKLMYFLEE